MGLMQSNNSYKMGLMWSNSRYKHSVKESFGRQRKKQVANKRLSLSGWFWAKHALACSPTSFKVMWKMFLVWYPERMNQKEKAKCIML